MSRGLVAGALAVVALITGLVVLGTGDRDHGYRVTAEFHDVEGIRKDFWVRVDGARAGTVEDVKVTRRDTAIVTMRLDKAMAPVGAGASVDIRPANLLGEKYLDLHRGDLRRPEPSGYSIRDDRTSVAVELDDVLNMLAPDVRARLRILVNEAGIALAGNGANFNAMFRELPPTLRDARGVVTQLARENHALARLVDRADEAVRPISGRREDVSALVENASRLLEITARRRHDLAASIRTAPGALRQIGATLDRLDVTARKLEPIAPLLQRTAPRLDATLRELPGFATSVREPLATATRVAPRLRQLGTRGDASAARLRTTVQRLGGFAAELRPLVYALGRAGGVDGAMGILDNWQKASSYSDGLSHFFDFHVSIPQRVLSSAVDRMVDQYQAEQRRRPSPSTKRRPPVLDLLTPHEPAPAKAHPLLPVASVPKAPPVVQNATASVQKLLDFLLK